MRIFPILATVLFASATLAATVEVTVPDGVTEIEVQYKLAVPPVDVTPEPDPTPVPIPEPEPPIVVVPDPEPPVDPVIPPVSGQRYIDDQGMLVPRGDPYLNAEGHLITPGDPYKSDITMTNPATEEARFLNSEIHKDMISELLGQGWQKQVNSSPITITACGTVWNKWRTKCQVSDFERKTPFRWPTNPADIPAWVPQGTHWFMTAEESLAGGQVYHKSIGDTHFTEGAVIPETEGDACVTWITGTWPANPGVIRESAPHYKTGLTHFICDGVPRDGAPAWKAVFGPGVHALPVTVWTRYPLIIEGVRAAGQNLSTIDCVYKNMKGGDRSTRTKTCIGGRYISDLTVRNLDMKLARFNADGTFATIDEDGNPLPNYAGYTNDSYRGIMPGDGDLLVENVTMTGMKNGVQGPGGRHWAFKNVKILNANMKGTVGKYHGIYTPNTLETLTIINSHIHVRAGHPVKTQAALTTIKNTTLEEGTGDTGAAFNSDTGQRVVMENVTMIQVPSFGNTQIFSIGGGGSRCKDTGYLDLKNVKIIDTDPRQFPRFKNACGRTEFIDRGGNTYQWMDEPERNLFGPDGRMDLKGVQP